MGSEAGCISWTEIWLSCKLQVSPQKDSWYWGRLHKNRLFKKVMINLNTAFYEKIWQGYCVKIQLFVLGEFQTSYFLHFACHFQRTEVQYNLTNKYLSKFSRLKNVCVFLSCFRLINQFCLSKSFLQLFQCIVWWENNSVIYWHLFTKSFAVLSQ